MQQSDSKLDESFQPIALRPPGENQALFTLRCMVDLQVLTIFRFLASALEHCSGRLLDVGAGQSPWRFLLKRVQYVGLDIDDASKFGMRSNPDIVYYDGSRIPFSDRSFDHVLCVEVMEHVPDPRALLEELARVLRSGGSLILTVPWSARVHHLPHDYGRFTRYGLFTLLGLAGFEGIRVTERGNDIAVIANKLVVLVERLLRPRRWSQIVWTWPLALFAAPLAVMFLAAAQVAIRFGFGSLHDPLGYGVIATKP